MTSGEDDPREPVKAEVIESSVVSVVETPAKTIVNCPGCQKRQSVPADRGVRVQCSSCQARFDIREGEVVEPSNRNLRLQAEKKMSSRIGGGLALVVSVIGAAMVFRVANALQGGDELGACFCLGTPMVAGIGLCGGLISIRQAMEVKDDLGLILSGLALLIAGGLILVVLFGALLGQGALGSI